MTLAKLCPLSTRLRCSLMATALAASMGCSSAVSSDDDAGRAPPSSPTQAPAGPQPTRGAPAASDGPPEAQAAGASFGGAAACGVTFDACAATPGCNEILACAARTGCAGADCYCSDPSCEAEGPCRSVIDSAPGAPLGAGDSPSRGPAADAAAAVGACLQGAGGGALPPSRPMPPSAPDSGASHQAPDAG